MTQEESTSDRNLDGAVDVETQSKAQGSAADKAPSLRRLGQLRSWKEWVQDVISPLPPVRGAVPRGDGLSTSGRYDPASDVILRIELVSSEEAKLMAALTAFMSLVSLALTVTLTYFKFKTPTGPPAERRKQKYFWTSVSVCAFLLLVQLWVLLAFATRLVAARRGKKQWSSRRGMISAIALSILALQTVSVTFSLAANALGLVGLCSERNQVGVVLGFFQWTIWNTIFVILVISAHLSCPWKGADPDAGTHDGHLAPLVFEAPWRLHLPKLAPWVVFEAANIYQCWYLYSRRIDYRCVGQPVLPHCLPSAKSQVFIFIMVGMCGVYLCLYIYYIMQTFRGLASRPYAEARTANMIVRMESWQIINVFVACVVCIAALLLLRIKSCWTYIFAWISMMPLQVMGTCLAVTLAFYFMPKDPENQEAVLSMWLQEIAWTERSLPGRLARRNAHVAQAAALQMEPMFCLETAIKLCYWSELVYTEEGAEGCCGAVEEQATDGLGALEHAMGMYGLASTEEVWDRGMDTRAVLAWGQGTLLIAFKGTSSTENIKTDLKLFKVVHPPSRVVEVVGTLFTGHSVPKVHLGFLQAWAGNLACDIEDPGGYRNRLLARVAEILAEMEAAAEEEGAAEASFTAGPEEKKVPLRIMLTGHSLGGGMATLAALDLAKAHPDAELVVYTFGQPRVGNRGFAHEYNHYVPHHFSVINDQDPVVRVPKGDYKKAGVRVIINGQGDLIVRPNFLEVQQVFRGAGVVGHHFLEAYRASFSAIISSQFTPRRLSDGEVGAVALALSMDLDRALLSEGLDLASLRDPRSKPITLEGKREKEERHAKRRASRNNLLEFATCMGCSGGQRPSALPTPGPDLHDLASPGSASKELPIQAAEGALAKALLNV